MGRILISSGGGGGVGSDELTATKSQVLEGTAYVGADTNDEIGQGGMPNQGAKTSTLNCGQSYTIPEGYHNGSGKITANSLASQTSATAAAGHILSGKTAWVNGSQVTGNIASQGALSYTPSTSAQTASVSGKYMTGNVTIGAIPSKYKDASGATISNNNQMLSGVKALGANGTLYTGNIASMAGGTYTPSGSTQTVSCSGKKMTSNVVINPIPSNYVNVKANQTVFNNGVCSICTRIYPKMWGNSRNGWQFQNYADLTQGASYIGLYPRDATNTYQNYYCYLDGTIQIGLFNSVEVTYSGTYGGNAKRWSASYNISMYGAKGNATSISDQYYTGAGFAISTGDDQPVIGQEYTWTKTVTLKFSVGTDATKNYINRNDKYFIGFSCFASYYDNTQAYLATARIKKITFKP